MSIIESLSASKAPSTFHRKVKGDPTRRAKLALRQPDRRDDRASVPSTTKPALERIVSLAARNG